MEAAAASAMDFHALSRRELQALCKRNGVRANMTNAAMADALQGLTSVDGIDEIGTTLCLPTPGRSTMKSAAKAAAVAGEEQQHGSPLPRGRRVSVMSPAAIRMDVEDGEDELKRDLIKEIVKTPGVALRSTSRRARATPAPLPTPATLRRSTRTAARKAAAPVEAENVVEEVSTVKTTTKKASARLNMMIDLDQEEEVAAATPKVQQDELKAVVSDVKCDDPEEEEETTKLLDGDNKEDEPEEGEEADSSDAANGSSLFSDKRCDDLKVEEVATVVEQEATKTQEGLVAEQGPISVEKSAPLAPMEDSPIFGVLSNAEAQSVIGKEHYSTSEDGEGVAEWSPVNETADEISPVAQNDKAVVSGEEAIKEDGFTVSSEILPAAVAEDEINEEDDLTEGKGGSADEMQQTKLIEDETSEVECDEDEEWTSDDDEASEEIDSTNESDDENDEINEKEDCIEVGTGLNQEELVQMLQETAIAIEAHEDESEEASDDESGEEDSEDESGEESSEDGSHEEASEDGSADEEDVSEEGVTEEEDDDFSSDLPQEFADIVVLGDAETDTTAPVLEENQVTAKSLDDSAISVTDEEDVTEEGVPEEAIKEAGNTVDTYVKSLDEFTIKEGTQQAEENNGYEAVGPKGLQVQDYGSMSMRKLRAELKDRLAAKEGKKNAETKRLPLEEVDDNAC